MEEKIYCPVNGWDCPYWQKDGTCTLEDVIEGGMCEDYDFYHGDWWEE